MTVHVYDHPLIDDYVTRIRDVQTSDAAFGAGLAQVTRLMLPAVFSDLKLASHVVSTPLESHAGARVSEAVVAMPVLRAGLGMLQPLVEILPGLQVSFFDISRDHETLTPIVRRAWLLDDFAGACVVLLDPMLATGGTLTKAVSLLRERGVGRIKAMSVIAAPEGIELLTRTHPDIQLYVAAVDKGLDANGYIVPGLGDAGDRLTGFSLASLARV